MGWGCLPLRSVDRWQLEKAGPLHKVVILFCANGKPGKNFKLMQCFNLMCPCSDVEKGWDGERVEWGRSHR